MAGKGRTGLFAELPDDLVEEFRRWVESFPIGTITQHIEWAIRRHMATPPTVTEKPLAKTGVPPPDAPRRGRPKKGVGADT